MKKLINTALFIGLWVGLSAQVVNFSKPYVPLAGKNFSYYNSTANTQLKNGDYRWAAANALAGLSATEKEKKSEKALILVKQAVPLAFEYSLSTIAEFKALAASSTGVQKVNYLNETARIYQELVNIYEQTQSLSEVKDLFNAEVKDYSIALNEANQNLQVAKKGMAEKHYNDALKLNASASQHWKNRLAMARALKMASHYQADYQEAKPKLTTLKNQGVLKIVVPDIQNSTNYLIRDGGMNATINNIWKKEGFEFLQLLSPSAAANADLIMQCQITAVDFYNEDKKPLVSPKTVVIDKKKEIIAKGTLTTYERITYAKLNYTYEIIDVQTGESLQTLTDQRIENVHTDRWYSFSGDRRVLSKSELENVQTDTTVEPLPSKTTLFSYAISPFKTAMSEALTNFVSPYAN